MSCRPIPKLHKEAPSLATMVTKTTPNGSEDYVNHLSQSRESTVRQ